MKFKQDGRLASTFFCRHIIIPKILARNFAVPLRLHCEKLFTLEEWLIQGFIGNPKEIFKAKKNAFKYWESQYWIHFFALSAYQVSDAKKNPKNYFPEIFYKQETVNWNIDNMIWCWLSEMSLNVENFFLISSFGHFDQLKFWYNTQNRKL